MLNKKIIAIVSSLCLLIAVLSYQFLNKDVKSGELTTGPQSQAGSVAPKQLQWEEGEQTSYSVTMQSDMSMAYNQTQGPAPQLIKTTLTGTLRLLVLKAEGAENQVLGRITDAKLDYTQDAAPISEAEANAVLGGMTSGILVSFKSDGTLAEFLGAPQPNRFANQLLRQVIAGVQYPLPKAAWDQQTWQTDEIDGVGRYQASYKLQAQGSEISVTKQKEGYSWLFADSASTGAVSGKVQGQAEASIDSQTGWPISIASKEAAEIALASTKLSVRGSTQMSYKRLATDRLAKVELKRLNEELPKPESKLSQLIRRDGELMRYAAANIDKYTLDQTIRKFQEEKALGKNPLHDRQDFDKTVAYIRVHGDQLGDLQKTLDRLPIDDPWLINSLQALAYVGCENCQDLLMKQLKSRESEPDFATSLVNFLSQSDLPSVAAEQYLKTLAQSSDKSIRNAAQLNLGTVAYQLREIDPARSERLNQEFIAVFRAADTMEDKRSALAVMGNAGSKDIRAPVEQFITNPDERIRQDGVHALRNLKTENSQDLLNKMLDDSSVEVRMEVVRAYSNQDPNPATGKILAQQLKKDTAPAVRRVIIQELGRYYKTVAEAREVLDSAAAADADPNVMLQAKGLIAGYGDGSSAQ